MSSSFWTSCLAQFEQELPPQQFNTWIRPLRLEGEDDPVNGLRLLAPNGFILKWVKERYLARIEELSQVFFSAPVTVALMLAERAAAPVGGVRSPSAPVTPARPASPVTTPPSHVNGGYSAAPAERPLDRTRTPYEKKRA